MSQSSLTARVRLTLEDYLALTEAYGRLTPSRRMAHLVRRSLDVILASLCILFAAFGNWPTALYFAAIGALLICLEFVVGPWAKRRSFRTQRLDEHEVTLTADDHGFRSTSAVVDATHRWEVIRHVDFLDAHVILWPNARLGFIVPHRGFANPGDLAAFIALVRSKVVEKSL